jgi:tRNA/rRNA methyltransferase
MTEKSVSSNRKFDVRVVLVRPIYERNVGSTSRAMANMGFKHLILIDPQCELTFEAQQAAATGQYALQNAKIYSNWDAFYSSEPRGIMLTTTARDGRGRQVEELGKTLQNLKNDDPHFTRTSDQELCIHLVFGPEDAGLNAKDISNSNFSCTIPTFGDNTSLNLSQAVLLALFIVRTELGGDRTRLDGQQKPKALQKKPMVFPDQTLRTWLQEMGFNLDNKKINVFTTLKRMMLQNIPSTKEFRVLEIVLQQSTRKLRELNKLKEKQKKNS